MKTARLPHVVSRRNTKARPERRDVQRGPAAVESGARAEAKRWGATRDAGTRLQLLIAMLEQVPSGALIAEAPSGRIVFWNEQARRHWPDLVPVPSMVERACRCQVTHSDGRPCAADEWPLTRALRTGRFVASDALEFIGEDGTRTIMDVRCTPVRDDDGQISAAVAILQDVTERTHAERALETSRARYENLYQEAPDMFASVAVDTQCIVQCNQTLATTTGYTRDELLGMPLRTLHHPNCRREFEAAIAQVRQAGRVRDAELQLQGKDSGVLDVSLSMAAIRDEQGNQYYRSTWRDITERTHAQAALREQQAELERSRVKLQALAGQLLTAQEDERRRISRDLHDDLNQRLALLTVEIEALCQQLPRSKHAIVQRLRALRDGAVELSDAVHSLAYQLHASILDDSGLPAALQSLVADVTRREGIEVELRHGRLIDALPSDIASCLYRVAQEALRNVARHSRVTHARLTLDQSAREISMTIADAGVGFDVPDAPARARDCGHAGTGTLGWRDVHGRVAPRQRDGGARAGYPAEGGRVTRPRVLLADDHTLMLAGLRKLPGTAVRAGGHRGRWPRAGRSG